MPKKSTKSKKTKKTIDNTKYLGMVLGSGFMVLPTTELSSEDIEYLDTLLLIEE